MLNYTNLGGGPDKKWNVDANTLILRRDRFFFPPNIVNDQLTHVIC